jgi:hypothetical protein
MVKRHLAGLIVAAVVAGGGAAAVAAAPGASTGDTSGGTTTTAAARPGKEQVQQCRKDHQAGQTPSDACKALREQVKGRKAGPGRPAAAGVLGRVVHGDLVVRGKDGTFENVTVDKGVVQSKGDNSITLKRDDGKTVTIKVDGATTYKGVANLGAVEVGKPAIVVSKDGTARLVGQRPPGGNKGNGSNVAPSEEQVPAT